MVEDLYPPINLAEDENLQISSIRDEFVMDGMENDAVPEISGVNRGCNVVEERAENDEDEFDIDVDPREYELQTVIGPRRTTHTQEGLGHASNVVRVEDVIDTLVPKDDYIGIDHQEASFHEMWNGRQFLSRESFRTALRKFVMYNNFELHWVKRSMTELSARCGDHQCPWRIHGSILQSGLEFIVQTYFEKHTCSKPMMGLAHSQATSALIADWIKERLRLHPSYAPKEIATDFQLEFGVQISYRKAWLAKEIALLDIRGSYEDSFRILPSYCIELERTNPGSVSHLIREDDDSFQRLFWAFGSSVRPFKRSLCPLIAVDGAHLHGKYPGVLFVAVTYDGDRRLFPIAFAIAEIEDIDTWEWFLAELNVNLGPFPNLTIVSDRQKGLIRAVQEQLPHASHCYYMRHISANFKEKYKDEALMVKFWNAARAYRRVEYKRYMAEIRDLNEGAFKWIEDIGPHHWANAFVEGRRYDMITTNVAECTNSLLKEAREYPITKQVDAV